MKIAVIGLGYVGLPLAVSLSAKFPGTLGFDVDSKKISKLKSRRYRSVDIEQKVLHGSSLLFSDNRADLKGYDFFVVTVPTPIDENRQPDLSALRAASEIIGSVLSRGSIVVYESTVYPGVTEEFCGPILEEVSGLKCGFDFKLAYSPERINPGDRVNTLETVVKVVSAQDTETLKAVSSVYQKVTKGGIHAVSGIRVAEACKVIENVQRDINIALMNELAMIFDMIGLSTREVLEAAGTKWNFLRFSPGLVGGHCIGVDPYYLTNLAQRAGYHPEVILAGRRINDGMGYFVARRAVKEMIKIGIGPHNARVGVMGVTFKENIEDIRNSRVFDIINELKEFGCRVSVHDPVADKESVMEIERIELQPLENLSNLDAVVLAVPHKEYIEMGPKFFKSLLQPTSVFVDVKSVFDPRDFADRCTYWSL